MDTTHARTRTSAARRMFKALALLLMLIMPLSQVAFTAGSAAASTLQTDLWAYSNGDTVTITGDGWTPGETVKLVTADPLGTVVDTGSALASDSASSNPGHLQYQFVLNGQLPGIYTTTGTGQTSGDVATVQFDPAGIAGTWDPAARTVSWTASGLNSNQCYRVRLLDPSGNLYAQYLPTTSGYTFFQPASSTASGTFTLAAGAPGGTWMLELDRDSGCNNKGTDITTGIASGSVAVTFIASADNATVTVDEGQTATNTGTWCSNALDATVTMTASVGTVVQTTDTTAQSGCQKSGHWSWSFPTTDGPSQSQVVTITTNDTAHSLSSSLTFNLTVNNVNPAVTMPADATIKAGATFSDSGSFADPGADSPWTATVSYGDGSSTQSLTLNSDKTFSLSHTYANPGTTSVTYTITVTVTDKDGGTGTGTTQVTVGPGNHPPAVAANTPSVTFDEGQTAAQSGTWSDPDAGDTVALTASVGSVVENGDGTWSWSYATTDGPSQSQIVTITATDSHGASTSASFSLTVNNVAPTATFRASPSSLTVGDSTTLSLSSPFDPSSVDTSAGFTYSFACDGATFSTPSATNSIICTFTTANSYTVSGRIYDKDGGYTEYQTTVSVARKDQTITFDLSTLPAKTYGDPAFDVSSYAKASSGLPVSFTASGNCTSSGTNGSTITITGAGSCTVTASQAGDDTYNPALSVSQTFTINPAVLTVTCDSFSIIYGSPLPSPLTYQISGYVNGDQPTIVSGTASCTTVATSTSDVAQYTITAGQNTLSAANYTFKLVNGMLTITPASQTITFNPLPGKTYGDPAFDVSSYAKASSGLPVSFTASGNCTSSGTNGSTITITGAGSCTVTASQNGNIDYTAATPVSQSFTIAKANQTINFGPLANKTYGDPAFTLSATASSGLPVSFTASGNCTSSGTNGSTITITGAGSCTVTASQGGNDNYYAATSVSQAFSIAPASQTITFNPLPGKTYGDAPFTVSASASSGLPVSFTATGNCSLGSDGVTVTITGAGSCTVTASQGGNSNYYAAPSVSQSFTIKQAQLTITADNQGPVQYSDALPALTWKYSGFVNNEGPSVLSGTTTCTTSATTATIGQVKNAVTSPAGTYTITCSGQTSLNYSIAAAPGTLTVVQEDAQIQYTGDTIGLAGSNLNLRATVWDSAASGYTGANPETGSTATIGDITKMWIAFDVYSAGSCGSGAPTTTKYAQVSTTTTPGIGTATTTFTSSTEASYCVVARLVAGSSGGTNQWYTALDAQSAGVTFYVNTGQFVTGGGWIYDPANSSSHGNFGFNARYSKSGSPQGQMVYVYRSMYNGVPADFIVKSNSLTALSFSGSQYPISAALNGKCSIQINRASNGAQLYGDGNATFSATATDSGQSSGIGSDSYALTVYDKNGVVYKSVPTTLLQGGNIVVHNK